MNESRDKLAEELETYLSVENAGYRFSQVPIETLKRLLQALRQTGEPQEPIGHVTGREFDAAHPACTRTVCEPPVLPPRCPVYLAPPSYAAGLEEAALLLDARAKTHAAHVTVNAHNELRKSAQAIRALKS